MAKKVTPTAIKKEVKFFIESRKKYLKAIKNMNYHLFPELIKTKVSGKPAVIRGIYIKNEGGKQVHKMEVHIIDPSVKEPTDFQLKKINQAKFDKLASTPGVITPKKLNASAINKQAKVFEEWLTVAVSGGVTKDKPVTVPNTSDLRKVSGYLKDNMKSIKGFYAVWNKMNEMGITLPFKYKPTIAKFERESEVDFHVDFNKGILSTNKYSPKYDSGPGEARDEVGKFKDVKQLLTLIKRHFTTSKKDEIARFNDSEANRWAR
jgi:hypothetical protein